MSCGGYFSLLVCCIISIFSVLGEIGVALACSIISSLLLLYEVRLLTGNFTNIAMIFVIFSALYGLSGRTNHKQRPMNLGINISDMK
jgi:hypothetical protein